MGDKTRRLALVAGLGLATVSHAGEAPLAVAGVGLRLHVTGKAAARAVRDAVTGARARLMKPECAAVVTDFAVLSGTPLDQNLAALAPTAADYLGLVLFVDGSAEPQCVRGGVVAWTQPGSRVVWICGAQFTDRWRSDRGFAEVAIIHEVLHTLGLEENPPSSAEITAGVSRRCR